MEQTPPIKQKYAFLAAIVLSLLMIFQSNVQIDGQWMINMNQVIVFAYNYLVWAAAIPFLFRTIRNWNLESGWKNKVVTWLIIALIICLVQLLISNLLYYATIIVFFGADISDPLMHFMNFFPRAFLSRIMDFAVIFLILRGLDNYRNLNTQKVTVAELEGELVKSRLEALKMQLNPHFLFNSLHAIHSLIGYEDDKARSMVMKMSNLLRRILELGDRQTIPLADELSYLRDYLDIEQERFHDRLEIVYEIDESLNDRHVPSLMLQPLAENAIKHGIAPSEKPGYIRIEIRSMENDQISLVITNSVDMISKSGKSTGIGLDNLRNRLEQLYRDVYELRTDLREQEFVVEIRIPTGNEH